jgi:lipopolysaccharide biosynthesis protein
MCGLILRRKNVGYDFGGFKDAIARIPDLGRLDSLLLANDSVYGPFHPARAASSNAWTRPPATCGA